jgi:hypothetical protein
MKGPVSTKMHRISARKVGIFYLTWLLAAMLSAVFLLGAKKTRTFARMSKEYAIIFEKAFQQETPIGEEASRIIYFGDSNSFHPPDFNAYGFDSDNHMHRLLAKALEKQTDRPAVAIAEWAFLGASTFDHYCMFFHALDYSPDLIIISINLRQLYWEQYPTELTGFVPLRERLGADFVPLKEVSLVRQLQSKISFLCPYPAGIKAWTLEAMGIRSAFAQEKPFLEEESGQTQTEDSFFYQSICELMRVSLRYPPKTLFFIWPVQWDLDNERTKVEHARELVLAFANEENIRVLDFSCLLGQADFFDERSHCSIEGRRKIAAALAPAILEILKKDE